MTVTPFYFILIASFGSLCQEIIQWYELRNKLDDEETKKMFKSIHYWLITILTIIVSGIGTMIVFYQWPPEPALKIKIPFILGAAFPLLFKKIIAAFLKRDLGDDLSKKPTFQEIVKKYYL